ncbi:hypothetical protein LINPERHAP1_LOCUS4214 [Linum perenne]
MELPEAISHLLELLLLIQIVKWAPSGRRSKTAHGEEKNPYDQNCQMEQRHHLFLCKRHRCFQ